ncbi:MAG: hypothetical protein GYA42_07235 [Syntrophomonadaceae bacterium]|nr:hypothetical protein [Syntrophomonadaceae bacterium]
MDDTVLLLILYFCARLYHRARFLEKVFMTAMAGLGGSLIILPLLEHLLGLYASMLLLALAQVLAIRATPVFRYLPPQRTGGYKF